MWTIRRYLVPLFLGLGIASAVAAGPGGFDKLSLLPVRGQDYLYGYVWSVDWAERNITISQLTFPLADAVEVFSASGRPVDPSTVKPHQEAAFKMEAQGADGRERVTEIHIGKQPPAWLVPPKVRYNPY